MMTVLRSFSRGFRDFFSGRMLLMMATLPLLSLVFWLILLFVFWTPWTTGLGTFFANSWAYQQLATWFPQTAGTSLGEITAIVILLLLLLPLTYFSTLLLVSLFVVPVVQKRLLSSEFLDLEKKKGGSFSGSLGNTLKAGAIYILLFIGTAPLWLVPGAQLLLPAALTAWVSRRVLTYDLLQDVATDSERKQFELENSGGLYGLGFLLGLLVIIPGAAFFLPVVATLAYGHFCFTQLRRQRLKSSSESPDRRPPETQASPPLRT